MHRQPPTRSALTSRFPEHADDSTARRLAARLVVRPLRTAARWAAQACALGGLALAVSTLGAGTAVAQMPAEEMPTAEPAAAPFAATTPSEPIPAEQPAANTLDFDAALAETVSDPDESVRIGVARVLSRLEPSKRDPAIAALARDSSPAVRVALLENVRGLGIGPVGMSAIRSLVDDEDARVRGYARLLVADWDASAGPSIADEFRPMTPTPRTPFDTTTAPRVGSNVGQRVRTNDQPLATLGGYPAVDRREAPTPAAFQTLAPTVRTENRLRSYWVDDEARDLVERTSFDDDAVLGGNPSRPELLNRPLGDEPTEQPFVDPLPPDYTNDFIIAENVAPWGFAGPSGVAPTEFQTSPHFVPVEDRWRIGLEPWDRYGKGHAGIDDYPGQEGHWWDPFNQNVLKGDYPIIGQHTFLNIVATSFTQIEWREVPTGTTPFESTVNADQEEFFGDPAQTFVNQNLQLQLNLFHGNTFFKPLDWQVRLTPIVNFNYLDVNELGVVNPDVTKGTRRSRDHVTLQEYFVEAKLADIGPDYDFVSVRAGNQFFNSDFRGHIFFDTNRGIRLFGSRLGNRDQFNLAFFDMVEKETNSNLNTFDDRHQNVFIANYYRQDFIFPGYTAQASIHYNQDQSSFQFDRNDFLVRPDPAGIFQEHEVDAVYLGFAGEGHIERFNYSNVMYWAVGKDSNNPIAGRSQDIDAYMGAIELSYDRDWIRFRTSFFYASGDDDLFDNKAEGFDTIMDDVNFAGGNFSYWQRNALRLFGVNVTQNRSLVADLRSSKTQGQANFVNPGLILVNGGMDFEITPKTRVITNVNYLWFDSTVPLEIFTFQDRIDSEIGVDMSLGIEYRPLLSDNVIMLFGVSGLVPGSGFRDLFGKTTPFTIENASNVKADTLYAAFFELAMTY